MRMRWLFRTILLGALIACGLSACSRPPEQQSQDDDRKETGIVTIYVVNYPLAYFAQRIGGDHVKVIFPAPPDRDPAMWRPDADTIARYQQADLILLNGASYAKWTQIVSLPASRVVDTSAAVRDQYLTVDDKVTHTHGPGGEHAHAGVAFTTWLDPRMAIAQAAAIRDAMIKLRPQHEASFQEAFSALQRDLNEIDTKMDRLVNAHRDQPIVFSHPVYQYLTRRYGLRARSLHWEPDQMPSPDMWAALNTLLKEHPATSMVWEGQPLPESIAKLTQLGIKSIVFDPCSNVPDNGDYLQVMQQNIENFRAIFPASGS